MREIQTVKKASVAPAFKKGKKREMEELQFNQPHLTEGDGANNPRSYY